MRIHAVSILPINIEQLRNSWRVVRTGVDAWKPPRPKTRRQGVTYTSQPF